MKREKLTSFYLNRKYEKTITNKLFRKFISKLSGDGKKETVKGSVVYDLKRENEELRQELKLKRQMLREIDHPSKNVIDLKLELDEVKMKADGRLKEIANLNSKIESLEFSTQFLKERNEVLS